MSDRTIRTRKATAADSCSASKSPRNPQTVPNIVVVDPRFESYRPLATAARAGRIGLHFRSEGRAALILARRHRVDAWLVAADLDDMSGLDFLDLLRQEMAEGNDLAAANFEPGTLVAVREPGASAAYWEAIEHGAEAAINKPIRLTELEQVLGMTLAGHETILSGDKLSRAVVTLPVSVGAAVVAIAVVMLG